MYLVTWCVILRKEDVNFFSEVGILEKIQKVLERFQGKLRGRGWWAELEGRECEYESARTRREGKEAEGSLRVDKCREGSKRLTILQLSLRFFSRALSTASKPLWYPNSKGLRRSFTAPARILRRSTLRVRLVLPPLASSPPLYILIPRIPTPLTLVSSTLRPLYVLCTHFPQHSRCCTC
jgi:hypothetical protein